MEWEKADAEFSGLVAIIIARVPAGLTQEEVARRMGTTQSAVARLANNLARGKLPSGSSLVRYAKVLGKRVKISFV